MTRPTPPGPMTGAPLGRLLPPMAWSPSRAETTPTVTTPTTSAASNSGACPDRPLGQLDRAPVLAHFYMWFSASSWSRAKIDFPAVGRYSSDQLSVVRGQVAQAR